MPTGPFKFSEQHEPQEEEPPPGSGTKADPFSDWPPPRPITAVLREVSPMLPEMLPEAIRPWVTDIALRMQCPLDFTAATVIVLVSSIIGSACTIRPKQKDDWVVACNLWGGIIGRPGMFKSPAITEGLRPLRRLELKAQEKFDEEMIKFATMMARFEAKQKALKTAMDREERNRFAAEGNYVSKRDLDNEFARMIPPVAPVYKRYRTNDSTIEKLAEILMQNPRGILVEHDELVGLLSTWNKQGHESDRPFHLAGWNGLLPHRFDRIIRGSHLVPIVCESIFGGIQPSKLLAHLQEAVNDKNNDGMIQRFQVLVYPDEPKDWKVVDQYPDTAAKNRAFEIIEKLASMNSEDFLARGAQCDPNSELPYFQFSPQAQLLFYEWMTTLQLKLGKNSESPIITEHLAKFRSLLPSLALIFHLIEVVDNGSSGPIPLRHAQMAAQWCDYLETHARRIYGLADNDSPTAHLGEKLKEGALKDGFRARDVIRKQWHGLHSKELVYAALDGLLEAGWLRQKISPPREQGGRPTTNYQINPGIAKKRDK